MRTTICRFQQDAVTVIPHLWEYIQTYARVRRTKEGNVVYESKIHRYKVCYGKPPKLVI